jgi:cell volume regulation protein A
MTNYIILVISIIIVLSYLFDISSRYSKIPAVILLIGLGMLLQVISKSTGLTIPNMRPYLPVIGTLGLILIVLHASLDLKLEKQKSALMRKSVLSALVLLILVVVTASFIFVRFLDYPVTSAVLNSIPLGIISSAVAIPSAGHLKAQEKEFIIYESSFSDIFGIMAFDFILFNEGNLSAGIPHYIFDGFLTAIIAVAGTSALAILLHKITYHVNYVIIMTAVILIYALAKLYHLPALLIVLVFGLALANSEVVEHTPINRVVNFEKFRKDVDSFGKILGELTFLVRSFFFIIFGYYTTLEGVLYPQNLLIALCVTIGILFIRWLFVYYVLRLKSPTLVLFAPRGLITILLFISIPAVHVIPQINTEVITLVILMTMLAMMAGNIVYAGKEPSSEKIKEPGPIPEVRHDLPDPIPDEANESGR